MTQGEMAVAAGERLFGEIKEHLEMHLEHMDFACARFMASDVPKFVKGVPYINIYGNRESKHKLTIVHGKRYYRIECQGQEVSGTVDKKLPYILKCLDKCLIADRAIIILDGEGFQPGAKEWLTQEAKKSRKGADYIHVCWSVEEGKDYLSSLFEEMVANKPRIASKLRRIS